MTDDEIYSRLSPAERTAFLRASPEQREGILRAHRPAPAKPIRTPPPKPSPRPAQPRGHVARPLARGLIGKVLYSPVALVHHRPRRRGRRGRSAGAILSAAWFGGRRG